MISEYSKQRIIDAVDVYDVLSEFLDLKKKGSRYECCCPFHDERTPSFSVNPKTNRWHCFGCGEDGDAIEFLMRHQRMTFPDALEWLAKRYHIEVKYDRKELSDEQQLEAKKRESMWALLRSVEQFFIEQFNADTPEAQAARSYAYNRWDEQFCKEKGIGYAPKGRAFIDHFGNNTYNQDLLRELGLIVDGENGSYAQFRDRITIPIRNRWGKTIAFTARYVGNNPEVAKYINSATSSVFKKDECLFGIDAAMRQARISNCFIIVEGAPDVLRMQQIGLTETIAPLGTALTEKQLDQLRRISKTVRFIPDSDAPKGRAHPPGETAVMKNGATAMRSGFEVYVREIPRTKSDDDNEVKKDPDSYITDRDVYLNMDDKPFVVWLAEKRFKGAQGQDLKREVVREIAELLILIEDNFDRDMCIDSLCRIFGKAKMWREAMKDAGRKLKEKSYEENADSNAKDMELLRKHNLIVRHNMYYTPGKEGELERLSNFILRPEIHVKGNNSLRVFKIVNEFGQEEAIELSQQTLGSMQAFQIAVESLGNFVWLAKPEKFNRLKEYLYANTPSAKNIDVLGWQPAGRFFAFADGIFAAGRFMPINDLGIVEYGGKSYYLPAYSKMYADADGSYDFERQFRYRCGNTDSLREYALRLAEVFGDGGKVGFAWLLACLFRDYIHSKTTYFPMLNLFGISRSGKTSLGVALASFFYTLTDPPKLGNTTVPAMSYMLSGIRNSVLVFDEYTNLLKPRVIDILKAIWNGKTASKMNVATSQMTSQTVYSGVIISGQHQPTSDDALFSRCIHLAYSKTSFSPEERSRFERLRSQNMKGNCHLAMEVLAHYDHLTASFDAMFDTVRSEISMRFGTEEIADRMLNNWAIPLAAYRVLETCLDLPFSYGDMFETFMRCLRYHNAEAGKTSETADFWRTLSGLRMIGKIVDGTHYVIKRQAVFSPHGGKSEPVNFGKPRALLYMNWAAVQGVLSTRANLNQMKMDLGALDNYLHTCPHFLGIKQQRFVLLLSNGTPDVEYKTEDNRSVKYQKTTRPMALVFDYEALQATADIDLETYIFPENAVDVDPDDTLPTPPEPAQGDLPF